MKRLKRVFWLFFKEGAVVILGHRTTWAIKPQKDLPSNYVPQILIGTLTSECLS